jgi:hypothetical protein
MFLSFIKNHIRLSDSLSQRACAIAGCLLLLSACSSWDLKERCEKTNWFQYSEKLAYQGRYLEEDRFVKECKDVDRLSAQQIDLGFKLGREKMCTFDEIEKRGENGIPVFFKFCDGLDPRSMKARFERGLLVFCTLETGYTYGRSGKIYQKVCSPQQEKDFLPAYFSGRREYLTLLLSDLDVKIAASRESEQGLLSSEGRLSREVSSLPNAQECRTIKVYDEVTKKENDKTVCEEAHYVRSQRNQLYSELSRLRASLSTLRDYIGDLLGRKNQALIDLSETPSLNEKPVSPIAPKSAPLQPKEKTSPAKAISALPIR